MIPSSRFLPWMVLSQALFISPALAEIDPACVDGAMARLIQREEAVAPLRDAPPVLLRSEFLERSKLEVRRALSPWVATQPDTLATPDNLPAKLPFRDFFAQELQTRQSGGSAPIPFKELQAFLMGRLEARLTTVGIAEPGARVEHSVVLAEGSNPAFARGMRDFFKEQRIAQANARAEEGDFSSRDFNFVGDLLRESPVSIGWQQRREGELSLAVAREIKLEARIEGLHAKAAQALAGDGMIQGWRVKEVATSGSGSFQDLRIGGRSLWDSEFAFNSPGMGTSRIFRFDRGKTTLILSSKRAFGQVTAVEALLVDLSVPSNPVTQVLGTKSASGIDAPPALAALLGDADSSEPIGYGNGKPGAAAIVEALAAFEPLSATAKAGVKSRLAEWASLEKKWIGLSPRLGAARIIRNIAKLHHDQQAIRGDRRTRSRFYYDDRGSVTEGKKFKAKDGTVVEAAQGAKLLRISNYGGIELIVEVPGINQTTARMWIWDGDRGLTESYRLPLRGEPSETAVSSRSTTFISHLFRQLVDVEAQMTTKNRELRSES